MPQPTTKHNLRSLYLLFFSLLEVLYPAIKKLPFPKNRNNDNIISIIATIQHTIIDAITTFMPRLIIFIILSNFIITNISN